jgi:hypothetical protein
VRLAGSASTHCGCGYLCQKQGSAPKPCDDCETSPFSDPRPAVHFWDLFPCSLCVARQKDRRPRPLKIPNKSATSAARQCPNNFANSWNMLVYHVHTATYVRACMCCSVQRLGKCGAPKLKMAELGRFLSKSKLRNTTHVFASVCQKKWKTSCIYLNSITFLIFKGLWK